MGTLYTIIFIITPLNQRHEAYAESLQIELLKGTKSKLCSLVQQHKIPHKSSKTVQSRIWKKPVCIINQSYKKVDNAFQENESVETSRKLRDKMDPKKVTDEFDRDTKQSLRRVLKKLEISYGSVQNVMNSSGYKAYMANIVEELRPNACATQVAFAESTLENMKNSLLLSV